MNWNATSSYLLELFSELSAVFWLAFFFRKLVSHLGQVNTLQFNRWLVLVFYTLVFIFRSPWHVMALSAALQGPMYLGFPIVAALKSCLVDEDQQGILQASLNLACTFFGCLGATVFGVVFDLSSRGDQSEDPSMAIWYLSIAAAVVPIVLINAWGSRLQELEGKRHNPVQALMTGGPVSDYSSISKC